MMWSGYLPHTVLLCFYIWHLTAALRSGVLLDLVWCGLNALCRCVRFTASYINKTAVVYCCHEDIHIEIWASSNAPVMFLPRIEWSRHSLVGIATVCGLDGRGSIPGMAGFFSSQRPARLWCPPSLHSSGYRGLFRQGLNGWGVKLTTHLQLMPRLRMVELYLHSPICLNVIVLN
jgi:hypothetical protein